MARPKSEKPAEEQPVPVPVEVNESEVALKPEADFVPREEFDAAVKDLRNEISRLKEHVDDLNSVVTAPSRSVTFTEITGPDDPVPFVPADLDDTPDYNGVQRSFDRGDDGTEWYQA